MGTAAGRIDPLSRDVASIRVHEHVCAAFYSATAEIRAVKMFVETGLKNGERCVYFTADRELSRELEKVAKELERAGRIGRAGALILLPSPTVSHDSRRFEPAQMLEGLHQLASAAEADGFPAVERPCELRPGLWRVGRLREQAQSFFPPIASLGTLPLPPKSISPVGAETIHFSPSSRFA